MSNEELQAIEDYIDDRFGSWNYFGIRSFVKSALDNELHIEYPNCPYSAKEILLWNTWNDKESFLFTAGGQAVKGEETADKIFGKPEIDPMTGKKNSIKDTNGIIGDLADAGTKTIIKFVGVAIVFYILFTGLMAYSNKKFEKMAL